MTKSSSFCKILFDFLLCSSSLLWLTACADTRWPTALTGEPGESVLNAPRPVGRPPSASATGSARTWPNLADVPNKTKKFTPPASWENMERQMNSDKIDADVARARMEAETPTLDPPFMLPEEP